MSRATVVLTDRESRQRVASWAMKAPTNTRVEFKESKRSVPQNAIMWAALTDVARQVDWHGLKLSADDWKLIFLNALKRELRLVPNIDGTGLVNLSGTSSSDLGKSEMSDLLELIFAFGAQHDVVFNEPVPAANDTHEAAEPLGCESLPSNSTATAGANPSTPADQAEREGAR